MTSVERVLKASGKFDVNNKPIVTVFTTNGYQVKGSIADVSEETILVLGEDGKSQVMFKHAISTIR